jgi:DNA-binding NarL/FixJ family response regulator
MRRQPTADGLCRKAVASTGRKPLRNWESEKDRLGELASDGLSLRAIAEVYGVSVGTIATHIKRHGLVTVSQAVMQQAREVK